VAGNPMIVMPGLAADGVADVDELQRALDAEPLMGGVDSTWARVRPADSSPPAARSGRAADHFDKPRCRGPRWPMRPQPGALDAGVPLRDVQDAAGHANPTMDSRQRQLMSGGRGPAESQVRASVTTSYQVISLRPS
jgi:hypothetical protein